MSAGAAGSEAPIPVEDQAEAARMMADYIAEMAEIIPGIRPDAPYPSFDRYWEEPDRRWPFWLMAGTAKAGFALLCREGSAMRLAEFFVARPHRRHGIGLASARRLIALYPGAWRITQREQNRTAIAFWHRVLDGFVGYEETTTETDAVRREQRFIVSGAPTVSE